MNNTVNTVMQPRAGLCPHGMPPSACPICSNMGGGGKKSEINFKSSPPAMMSWNQCEAIGYFLKAQRRASEKQRLNFKLLTLQLQLQSDKFQKLAFRLQTLAKTLNSFPVGFLLSIPIKIFAITPVQIIANSLTKITDISDKIAAIFGEIKKGLEKAKEKLNEFINELKNKIFKLFEIFNTNNNSDKNNEINEEKKIFKFSTLIKKLRKHRSEEKNEA